MNHQQINSSTTQQTTTIYSWNRQRSDAELTSFINRKLAQLSSVSLVD